MKKKWDKIEIDETSNISNWNISLKNLEKRKMKKFDNLRIINKSKIFLKILILKKMRV